MTKAKLIVISFIVFLVSGCAANTYFVEVDQSTNPKDNTCAEVCKPVGNGNGNGSNVFVIAFDKSPISTTKDQKSTGEIPVGYNGGTAGSGSSALKDIVSKFAPTLSKKDNKDTSTTNESVNIPIVPTTGTTVEEVE